jgi:Na+/proline symporter
MRAVVWNDALQIVILIIGLIVVAALGASKAGGGAAVWEIAKSTGRVNYGKFVQPTRCFSDSL